MSSETKEKICAHSLIYRIEESIVVGDIMEAKRCAVDLLNSLRELERIQEKHRSQKRVDDIIQKLQENGVLVERVKKHVVLGS
ncbi:hypothetical protein [Domibacillus aminovorans]|uniref:Uncharacterized protein n=1 Tax=Domibacillus aminovorans TaxID=29332 RepID=A0A177L3W4_9BACI|nr:hypothetical protein [Domibacillus aminovorans]OAH60104.1 hypothetical protein AWH49_18035 [Domibacillus aminovorans]